MHNTDPTYTNMDPILEYTNMDPILKYTNMDPKLEYTNDFSTLGYILTLQCYIYHSNQS